MKVTHKIVSISVAAVVSVIVIVMLQQMTMSNLLELEQQEVKVNIIRGDMLMLRRNEKDFLARKTLKYKNKFNKNYKVIKEHAGELSSVLKEKGFDVKEITELESNLEAYQNKFNQLVSLQEEIGLHAKDALYGKLRKTVHNAETDIKASKNYEILSGMLTLRRNEKDFMLRNNLKYFKKLNKNLAILQNKVQVSGLSNSNTINGYLTAYGIAFTHLVNKNIELGLNSKQGLLGEMREVVHKTEGNLKNINIMIINVINNKKSSEFMFSLVEVAVVIVFLILGALVISRNILRPIKVIQNAMDGFGSGDLTYRLPDLGNDEIGETGKSLNTFMDKISEVLIEVNGGATQLSTASQQVSETAQALSSTSSEQAASVEETSAALEQMGASIQQNAENAKTTDNLATSTSMQANEGGGAVKETVEAMSTIASKITVIEDIAYKTNLLALNAAIEAARAGEHGKGFAVVADEVRKLAERSQNSAQEISALATNSVKVAEQAGNLINEMVPNIQQTADLVQEISAASDEQSAGVEQLNSAVNQLDKAAQHGASSSEELAATSEEMTSQVEELRNTIGFFKLESESNDNVNKRDKIPPVSIVKHETKKVTYTKPTKVVQSKPVVPQQKHESTNAASSMQSSVINEKDFERFT